MDKTIKRYASPELIKITGYRDWQRLPASDRIRAVSDITWAAYALNGHAADAPRLQRTLVRVQRNTK